jgi:hypothetical protein
VPILAIKQAIRRFIPASTEILQLKWAAHVVNESPIIARDHIVRGVLETVRVVAGVARGGGPASDRGDLDGL